MTDTLSMNNSNQPLESEHDAPLSIKHEPDTPSPLKCEPDVSPTAWNKFWESLQSPLTEDQAKKRKRGLYSLGFKLRVLAEVDEKKINKSDICKKYGIPNSTLSGFLATRDQIETAVNDSRFSLDQKICKPAKHENIEKILYNWFSEAHAMNMPISGPILMEKATQIAQYLGISFTPTLGWLKGFKRRKGLHYCPSSKTWYDRTTLNISNSEGYENSIETSNTANHLQNDTGEELSSDKAEDLVYPQLTTSNALDLSTVNEDLVNFESSSSGVGDVQSDEQSTLKKLKLSSEAEELSKLNHLRDLDLTVNEPQNCNEIAKNNISTCFSLKELDHEPENTSEDLISKQTSQDTQNLLTCCCDPVPTIEKAKKAMTVLRGFLESNDGSEQHLLELSNISEFIDQCSVNYSHKSKEALAVLRQFLNGQAGSERQMKELSSIGEFVDKCVGKYHQTSIKDFFK